MTLITGKLYKVGNTTTYNSFQKREIVVLQSSNYIKITLKGNDVSSIDAYQLNSDISINVEITGRQWMKNGNEEVIINELVGTLSNATPAVVINEIQAKPISIPNNIVVQDLPF